MNKMKKINKIDKYADFRCGLRKLGSNLKINITKMGEMQTTRKMYDNFR